MSKPKPVQAFFTKEQEEQIIASIRKAEKNCSGEIRVHLESQSGKDPYKRATAVFEELGMHKTQARNGVLFYLATEDHKFTILGDKGIDEKCEDNFWEEIKDTVISKFKEGDFVGGLTLGISMAGKALSTHFPHQMDDEDELSNEISKS